MKEPIVITISPRYFEIIGKPDLSDDLVKRAIYLRMDAPAIRGISEGFEARPSSVIAVSDEMGYSDQPVFIEVRHASD
nr:MAG: hypothetical protein 1 [Guangxi cystovirus 11]